MGEGRYFSLQEKGGIFAVMVCCILCVFFSCTHDKSSILSKDHGALNDLLAEAEQVYEAAQENLINIYVSES